MISENVRGFAHGWLNFRATKWLISERRKQYGHAMAQLLHQITLGRLLSAAVPCVYILVFSFFLFVKGDSDWDQALTFHRISLWSFGTFGLAKGWNPLMAGGMSLAGDPQVGVLSLSMLFSHLIAPVAAIKIACLFYLLLGFLGTFTLARRLGLNRETACLAGSLFMGNGYILSRFSHGHVDFLGSLCLPLWLCGAHSSLILPGQAPSRALRRLVQRILAFGVLFALACDGAPISFLLTTLWVGLYAAILAWQKRSLRPIVFLSGAVLVGTLIDGVYFFPMIANQFTFPRVRSAAFFDPLIFPYFLILPVGGQLIPAPANGHELSVYIGPIIAYLIVRYRHFIVDALPADEIQRMAFVSLVVLVVGLGSWQAFWSELPPSPFDVLHHLPGFQTVRIAPRFWGFLALPLALAGAIAIRSFERGVRPEPYRKLIWIGLFVFTIGFQLGTLAQPFLSERARILVPTDRLPSHIDTITNTPSIIGSQAATILPARGVIAAYNDHEYLRGDIDPGSSLVRWARTADDQAVSVMAKWEGWNTIIVALPPSAIPITIVLNQNFHPYWTASVGALSQFGRGNLMLRVPPLVVRTRVAMEFRDPFSSLGLHVTVFSGVIAILAFVAASGRWRGCKPSVRVATIDRAVDAEVHHLLTPSPADSPDGVR
jgi:hypothetical protein